MSSSPFTPVSKRSRPRSSVVTPHTELAQSLMNFRPVSQSPTMFTSIMSPRIFRIAKSPSPPISSSMPPLSHGASGFAALGHPSSISVPPTALHGVPAPPTGPLLALTPMPATSPLHPHGPPPPPASGTGITGLGAPIPSISAMSASLVAGPASASGPTGPTGPLPAPPPPPPLIAPMAAPRVAPPSPTSVTHPTVKKKMDKLPTKEDLVDSKYVIPEWNQITAEEEKEMEDELHARSAQMGAFMNNFTDTELRNHGNLWRKGRVIRQTAEQLDPDLVADFIGGGPTYTNFLQYMQDILTSVDPNYVKIAEDIRNRVYANPDLGYDEKKDPGIEFNALGTTGERANQLAQFIEAFAWIERENAFPVAFNNLPDELTLLNEANMFPTLLKEMSRSYGPGEVAQMFLMDPALAAQYDLDLNDKTTAKTLNDMYVEERDDWLNYQNEDLDEATYQTNVANRWGALSNIIRAAAAKAGNVASSTLPNSVWRTQLDQELRKRIQLDLNVFYQKIRGVQQIINRNPTSRTARVLTKTITDVVDMMNDGKLTIEAALNMLNLNPHVLKAVIQGDVEMRTDLQPEGTIQWPDVEEKKFDPTVMTESDFRRSLGQFSFEGMTMDPTKLPPTRMGMVYPIDKKGYLVGMEVWNDIGKFRTDRAAAFTDIPKMWTDEELKLQQDAIYAGKGKHKKRRADELRDLQKNLYERAQKTLKAFKDEFPYIDFRNVSFSSTDRKTIRQSMDNLEAFFINFSNFSNQIKSGAVRTELDPTKFNNATRKLYSHRAAKAPKVEKITGVKFKLKQLPVQVPRAPNLISPEQQRDLNRKFAFDNLKYAKHVKKEEPEIGRSEYLNGAVEYNVKSDADLQRMRGEVQRNQFHVFAIDYSSGRLYPVPLKQTVVGMTYILVPKTGVANVTRDQMKKGTTNTYKGGAFAYYPALHAIQRDERETLPFAFMRNGNDKAMQRLHHLGRKPGPSYDIKDQARAVIGAGFWQHFRRKVNDFIVNTAGKPTENFVKKTVSEGANFYNQEKKNVTHLYQSQKKFYQRPSFGSFMGAVASPFTDIPKIMMQPTISSMRQVANVSEYADQIPGLNIAKSVLEKSIAPEFAIIDALSRATKYSGIGSNDKANIGKTALALGDALLGSKDVVGQPVNGAITVAKAVA